MTHAKLSNRISTLRLKPAASERGTALIMAMVILLILTIIGVAALSTSSLEQKMAGNLQDSTRAFEAAESALAKKDTSGLDLFKPAEKTYSFGSGVSAKVTSTFTAFVPPKRTRNITDAYGSGYNFANFQQVSEGTTSSDARAVVFQGIKRVTPGQSNY